MIGVALVATVIPLATVIMMTTVIGLTTVTLLATVTLRLDVGAELLVPAVFAHVRHSYLTPVQYLYLADRAASSTPGGYPGQRSPPPEPTIAGSGADAGSSRRVFANTARAGNARGALRTMQR